MFHSLQLRYLVEVRSKQLDTLNVVDSVKFLILRVSPVITGSHREQHDISSCGFLESQSNWNATALTSQVRLHTKHCLHGLSTSHVVGMVEVRHPRLCPVAHVNLQLVGTFQFSKLLL